MITIRSHDRIVATLLEDGTVQYDPEYGPEEAADVFWDAMGTFLIHVQAGGDGVTAHIPLNGQSLELTGGGNITGELVTFWQAVQRKAPLRHTLPKDEQ